METHHKNHQIPQMSLLPLHSLYLHCYMVRGVILLNFTESKVYYVHSVNEESKLNEESVIQLLKLPNA